MLKKAQQDFAGVEDEYSQLIERREKAATVLYEALLKGAEGGGSGSLTGVYSPQDLDFLKRTVSRMPLREFSNDLGAQNLALRYLAGTDSAAHAQYQAKSDGLMGRTRGYIRTAGGVVAFSALMATFAQEVMGALRGKQGTEIVALLPFAAEFVLEVPPLLKVAYEAGVDGVVLPSVKTSKRFRVVDNTNATLTEDLPRAKDMFVSLQKRQAEALLTEAIFRNDSSGLLYKLYLCDKLEAGRLLDSAVPAKEREEFGLQYIAPDKARFSFLNAFELPGAYAREEALGDDLLRRDHRERTSDTTLALSQVQQSVARNYARWSDEQLMRLIFANREGLAAHATLQLGNTLVRPVPSMQSVYAYESLVDGCRRGLTLAAEPAPAATAEPTAPAPRTTVTPAARPSARPPVAGKAAAKP